MVEEEDIKDMEVAAGTSTFMNDGAYANMVTGLGNAASDKDEHVRIQHTTVRPNYEDLAMQFVRDGIVKRLCKEPADKALKTPIVINGDENDKAYKELVRLGFFKAARKAGTWARLFGGAIVVTMYDRDGNGDLSKPAEQNAKVVGYRVYSPGNLILTEDCISDDQTSPLFGKVERWPIQLRSGKTIIVHGSRVHVFKGDEVPDVLDSEIEAYVFGASVVDMANSGIKKLPGAFGAISNMLQENGLAVFGLNGLSGMLQQPNGVQKVRERMNLVKLGMSSMRSVFQDKEDTFEMKSHSMGDVPESVKMIMAYCAALTGIPVSILFGNMVSGLSSTNDGDIRQYNDLVEQWRADCLYDPMCEMLTDFMNRNMGKSGTHDFQFGEVSQVTANEKADIREKNMNFCKGLYEIGSMTPKEIRENLVLNGGTNEISVKGGDVPAGQAPAKES
jgi:phage-related protein (TIGR01555 family)